MNKEQIKEAILGEKNCRKEDTPLCQFSTFHPDMEMVEVLLKGADIDKSFNRQPMAWVFQFCEPNWDEMLTLLFKYKYHALHLNRPADLVYLFRMLDKLKPDTIMYIFEVFKKHKFHMTREQIDYINKSKRDLQKETRWKDLVK